MTKIEPDDAGRLVRRLLGPAEPEVSCEECFERLDRYVELELDGCDPEAVIPGMRAHFEGCAACEDDRESLRGLLIERERRPQG